MAVAQGYSARSVIMVKVQGSSDQLLSPDEGRANSTDKKKMPTKGLFPLRHWPEVHSCQCSRSDVCVPVCTCCCTGQRSKVPAYSYVLLPLAKPGAVAFLSDLGVGSCRNVEWKKWPNHRKKIKWMQQWRKTWPKPLSGLVFVFLFEPE